MYTTRGQKEKSYGEKGAASEMDHSTSDDASTYVGEQRGEYFIVISIFFGIWERC